MSFNLLIEFQNMLKILTTQLPSWHIWLYAELISEDPINEDGLMRVYYYNGRLCSSTSPVS